MSDNSREALEALRDKVLGWIFRRDETNGSAVCFAVFIMFLALGEWLAAIAFFLAAWASNVAGVYWRKRRAAALISETPKGETP